MSEWLEDIKERFAKYQTDYNLNGEDVEWLIQQAEKREYWMKQHRKRANELEDAYFKIQLIENQLHQAQAKAERYKQALEFYAESDNYQWEVSYRPQQEIDCMVIDDSGHTARKALEGKKMTDKERLEEIKEHVKKIGSIIYDEWRQQELTNLIESLYYDDHVDWLINRIEKLEKVIGDLDENVAAFETLWLEEKRKNQRYKQALEFYADEENFEPSEVQIGAITKDGYKISRYKYDPRINIDNGEKARQVLKGE